MERWGRAYEEIGRKLPGIDETYAAAAFSGSADDAAAYGDLRLRKV